MEEEIYAIGWEPSEEEGKERSKKFTVEFENEVDVRTVAYILRAAGPLNVKEHCTPLPAVLKKVKPKK